MEKITIVPTTVCNLYCDYCGEGDHIKEMTMDDSILERLLEEVKELNIYEVIITGGEVTNKSYGPRLIEILRKTEVGKGRKLMIGSNGWWDSSFLEELASVYANNLLLSTDYFHAQQIPIANIADIIKNSKKQGINVDNVAVRSFRSTYHKDLEIIQELAELVGEPIDHTTAMYVSNQRGMSKDFLKRPSSPLFEMLSSGRGIRTYTEKGFVDFHEKVRGFDNLKFISSIMYALGDAEYSMMFGACGTHIKQMWALREGCARKTIDKDDLIDKRSNRLMPIKLMTMYDKDPAVMPDGSLLPNCAFSNMNDYKRSRFGKFPDVNLREFDRRINSFLYRYGQDWLDILSYVPGLVKESVRR